MNININGETIEFKSIELEVLHLDICAPFYEKNNKTLGMTIEHKKYAHLKWFLTDKYKEHEDKNLGDFLKTLKETNDKHYLCFLNKYGDNKFCEFKIKENQLDKQDRGIYRFIVSNEPKYIGRCTDNFIKRINYGYGKIHPKNCFRDGQATNCHLNSLINSAIKSTGDKQNVKFVVYCMKNTDEIKKLEKSILECRKYEWNIQTS